jgi:glyoxylase-like metal-dependent hydrolase (beta-lactamase superfamily II)
MTTGAETARGITTVDAVLPVLARRPKLEVERLAACLWSATDGRARAVFAEGRSAVAAFDTLSTPGAAAALREEIARLFPSKPITTLVYTHDHLDASGWGRILAPHAEVVAHEATDAVVRLRRADGQLPATRTIRGAGEELDLDGVKVVLRYPGPTHGTGNLAVLFEEARVLFMSGTALPNARYGFFPDYHIGSYARSMRRLQDVDFTRFVPGRFGVCDRAAFVHAIDYFEALDEACQRAYVEPAVFIWIMDDVGAYAADLLRQRFGHLDGFDSELRFGAFRIVHHYLMGGWGREDTPAEDWSLYEFGRPMEHT